MAVCQHAAHYPILLQQPMQDTYRLVGQLHERRVIQLPDLIFGPVVAWSTSIHSSPHRSLSFWRWRWSCRYRREGVVDGRTERSHASHGSGGGGSQASCRCPLREQTQRHGYRFNRSVVGRECGTASTIHQIRYYSNVLSEAHSITVQAPLTNGLCQ